MNEQKTHTIQTSSGVITIDAALFLEYSAEAHTLLAAMENAAAEFKDFCESVESATGMKKAKVGKYFKARFKEATREVSAEGALFEQLDDIVGGQ